MWLEGRGIGPINPHVPYSTVTAPKRSLVAASQQHHGSSDTAGERGGGSAISETKAVCSQNRCKTGRSHPNFSHLLPRSSPSKQADRALEESAGGSFSQANAVGWYIVLMTIWVQVHKKRLNSLSSSTLLQMPADADNFQLLLTEEAGVEEVTKRQRPLYLWSAIQLSPQAVDFKLKNS